MALGIYLMSRRQQDDHAGIVSLLDELGLDCRLASIAIERTDLLASLMSFKAYVRESAFWDSAIDELPIDQSWASGLCVDLHCGIGGNDEQ